ncbi:unnamed protein product [Pleuronectes platessa]|uniref:Uncharacterized protein n=1 Tax=Pleuronectes platessa TaxID=8262 RepID=A0A9N7UBC3_PLEPL|nr:unnamed protein product [Pleuronectes platessa]
MDRAELLDEEEVRRPLGLVAVAGRAHCCWCAMRGVSIEGGETRRNSTKASAGPGDGQSEPRDPPERRRRRRRRRRREEEGEEEEDGGNHRSVSVSRSLRRVHTASRPPPPPPRACARVFTSVRDDCQERGKER